MIYPPLTAFRVTYDDGSSFVTSMSPTTTLEDAREYYVGTPFWDECPVTGRETRRIGVSVERVR